MLRRILFFFLLAGSIAQVRSQNFWAQGVGGNNVDECMDICASGNNIISAGYFTNTADFGPNISLTSASVGIPDIYVSKSSGNGTVLWAVRAGGNGSDRALSVIADPAGNSYITGFYFSTATFGNITLNSSNGSKDAFIAKLDPNGVFLWAFSCGGNLADIGNAIALDAGGNVIVTGQFEGTATFGTAAATSVNNPSTGNPSIDIFTVKLSSSGTFIWLRTGKAEFTDRGLDVACDALGNIFICGQFSDTIVFNNTHNNQAMNAVFLVKYDGAGNEIWFRRASGTYSIAYALTIAANNDVIMTGDYQGTLAFFGPPINFLNDNYTNRIFLARYSNSGNFIWASSESSGSYLSSRGVAIDPNGDIYLAGEFRCTLNDFADVFGQGTFNSVGYQDLVAIKFSSSGSRIWMRNFGGPGNDKSHGIIIDSPDKPILGGSFEDVIHWPTSTLQVFSDNLPAWGGNLNGPYCSDTDYGVYSGLRGSGFSDGFFALAIDTSRAPYDYYRRTGQGCNRPFVPGCIDSVIPTYACPDTLTFCGIGFLYANTFTGSIGQVGPNYNYQWSSTPGDTFYIDTIYSSGYYSVIMTTVDGCYTTEDSIYALVHPVPASPTITDDHGVNINQPPAAFPIIVCAPDTILLSGGNINGNSFAWYYSTVNTYFVPPPVSLNDSMFTDSAGFYHFELTNSFGCKSRNVVQVVMDSILPLIVPKPNWPDTIVACYGDEILLPVYDSLTGGNYFVNLLNTWSATPSLSISSPPNHLYGIFTATSTGTYVVNEMIIYYNACGADTFYLQDSFHLIVNPVPTISVNVSGPNLICLGDSFYIYFNYTASTTLNTNILINPSVDSMLVTGPGYYSVSGSIQDTITGCWSSHADQLQILVKPDPVIYTIPASGLICPNDSVQIICNTTALSYTWIGPNGVLPFVTQSIYANTPGFYHCIVLDPDSCVLTSNTVELKQYNTPYLVAQPSNIVCFGQNVTLTVVTADSSLIQWQAPLSGSSTTQIVNQTGIYVCWVTMCNITTVCSISVVVSQAIATITGPLSICPGDSALLVGASGMASYYWTPPGIYNDSIYVQQGTYTLTTTDANGCTASASHTVVLDTSIAPPSVSDTIVCLNTSATLYAFATGNIEWYSSSTSPIPIATGNPFVTPSLTGPVTYWVCVNNNGCRSIRVPVNVLIDPASYPVNASGPTPVCDGDTIQLFASSVPNVTYTWTGPNSFFSNAQNPFINGISPSGSGYYMVTISSQYCTSPADTVLINVIIPPTILLTGTDTVCQGDSIVLTVTNPNPNAVYNWTGPLSYFSTGSQIVIFPADTLNSGVYSVTGNLSGCSGQAYTFSVFVKPMAPPVLASSNSPICTGDTLELLAIGTGNQTVSFVWNGPNGYNSSYQNNIIFPSDSSDNGIYYVYALLDACPGIPAFLNVVVNPNPSFSLGPDTTVCNTSPLLLSPGSYATYLWQDSSTNSGLWTYNSGLYWVYVEDQNGCRGSDSVNIFVIDCNPSLVNVITPNGDGVNDLFTLAADKFIASSVQIFNRYGALIYKWDDPAGSWDGRDKTTRDLVSPGTYYYVAEVTTLENQVIILKGYLQLIW